MFSPLQSATHSTTREIHIPMRNLVLLLLGLAIGALVTANVINALRQRDAYPRGLMNVMQHHYAALREQVRRKQCTEPAARELALLRSSSTEIGEAVYAGDTPDAPFREFQQRLDDALAAAPANCADAASQLERISAACEACHRQYR